MIIDTHVHLSMSKEGLKPILDACDKESVDKVCLLAKYPQAKQAFREAPDRVIPVAQINMDREQSSLIHLLVDNGIKGLKTTNPKFPYDHERYHGFYATAEEYGLPFLFHTGIVSGRNASAINDNMRPIFLDHLSRTFLKLKIVMAHLGNPWWEEGAMAVRYNQTLYFDLSGSSMKRQSPEYFRSLLWWGKEGHPYKADGDKLPCDKLLFGTDVAPNWMHDVRSDYERLMDCMEASESDRRKIMGETAAEIYGV